MSRLLSANSIVYDQTDILDGSDRIAGVTVSDLSLVCFRNNMPQSWVLVDGTNISASNISSGSIYFNEIYGCPGFYSVRFLPNATGFWRLVLTYVDVPQSTVLEYDITANFTENPSSGLIASFIG
jgi:hypothetical protein